MAGFRSKQFTNRNSRKAQRLAADDTFQYLLDDVEGVILPVVTTVLWEYIYILSHEKILLFLLYQMWMKLF